MMHLDKKLVIIALSSAVIGGIIGGCVGGAIGSHMGRNRGERSYQRMGGYGMMGGNYRQNGAQNRMPSQTGQSVEVNASTTAK
jgi:outer membrane lipoprotein SlyB